MRWLNRLKLGWVDLDDKASRELNLRVKYPGYFRKWIFITAMLWVFVLFLVAANTNGWTLEAQYVKCDSNTPCLNPFYEPGCYTGLCFKEFLQPGEVLGTPPNWLYTYFELLSFAIVAAAFVLNHWIFQLRGAYND